MASVLKTEDDESHPGVRIPHSPIRCQAASTRLRMGNANYFAANA